MKFIILSTLCLLLSGCAANDAHNHDDHDHHDSMLDNQGRLHFTIPIPDNRTDSPDHPGTIRSNGTLNGDMFIRFLEAGTANVVLITLPDADILIDAGVPNATEDISLLPAIAEYVLDGSIEYLIFTNDRSGWEGECSKIAGNVTIINVIQPWVGAGDSQCTDALVAAGANIAAEAIETAAYLELSQYAKFQVLHGTQNASLGDASLGLRVDAATWGFLLTSTYTCNEEAATTNAGMVIGAEVLHLSARGSNDGSCDAWIANVNPLFGIASGLKAMHGYPTQEVVEQLRDLEAATFVTGDRGDLTFEHTGTRTWNMSFERW